MIPAFIDKSILPHKPGVYIFKDKAGGIIYVGKAVDLYHRVASYFNGAHESPKTTALVENINSCETIEVLSELEALILEANLIKRHLPSYNIRLTDDKDYLYIKVTNDSFPKIVTARKKELADSMDFFGPFPSGRSVRLTLKKVRRLFPWCSGTTTTGLRQQDYGNRPKDYGLRTTGGKAIVSSPKALSRPCFEYHLGLCPGACIGKVTQQEYMQNIKRFIKFLQGKKEEVLEELNREMEEYAKKLEYEKAQTVKKTIEGIEYILQPNKIDVYLENPNFISDQNKQSIEELQVDLQLPKIPERIECFDISNMGGQQAVGSLVVLTNGEIDKRWYRKFKIIKDGKPNDFAMMAEIIQRRLKHPEWPFPDLILIDGGRGQVRAAFEELAKKGKSIPVYGLAKRMEWLYPVEGEVIKLSKRSLSLRALQKLRDEAHRFAITYHRKLRNSKFYPE